jgi:uncharacterized protein involved in exopolysaccharide biosynthesis
MSTSENNQAEDNGEISINFGEVFRTLKSYKLLIGTCAVLFAALGAIYSLTQPNEYSSNAKLLPELDSQSGNSGGLKSLAGLAGIDLGGGTGSMDALRPDLYPIIITSTPFLKEFVVQKTINLKTNKRQFIYEYILENQNEPVINLFNNQLIVVEDKNKNISNAVSILRNAIKLEIDKKSGIITIKTTLNDKISCFQVTELLQVYLTKFITKYKTQKTSEELQFIEKNLSNARERYTQAISSLSIYRDQNMNLFLNVAKDREKSLQHEVDLSFNMFTNLSVQFEETKLKLKRETPIYRVLEPAEIPTQKQGPKRSLIIIGFMFFGIFFSLIYVFLKTVNLKAILS